MCAGWAVEPLNKEIPDTIGVSQGSQDTLKQASLKATALEIPGYRLLKELGRGNFGSVWEATREKTGQSVAIKIVDSGTSLDWSYFQRELDFLRELEEHPHTLTILDAQLDHDPPFIVMPLASAGSLENAVNGERPSVAEVEKWLEQLADALAFVHGKGIIHCDLKPSNILLSSNGNIRIADLGQARKAGQERALGTLGFMAPEQCTKGAKAVPSVSWDIYGFGATAYWLLTGKIPRKVESLGDLEAYRQALESEPLVPLRRLNPAVDEELAALVEKCLALQPDSRPPTIEAVTDDLERRKAGLPLLCRQPWSLSYRWKRALGRRSVQALGLVFLLFLALLSAAWMDQRDNRFRNLLITGIHAHESGRLEEAYLSWLKALGHKPTDPLLLQRLHFMPLSQVFPHSDRVTDLEVTAGGDTLISSSAGGELTFWDTDGGNKTAELHHPAHISELTLSPEGKLLASASWDGKARIFDAEERKLKSVVSHDTGDFTPALTALTFCDGNRLLATADLQGRIRLWETATGSPRPLEGVNANPEVRQLLIAHPKKPLLAALSDSSTAALWSLESGRPLPYRFSHSGEVNSILFDPGGDHLLTGSDDNQAILWNLKTGLESQRFGHESRVNTMIFTGPTRFAVGCEDGTVSVWEVGRDKPTFTFYHRSPVRSLDYQKERDLLAVGTGESENLWSDVQANGTVRLWSLSEGSSIGGPWPHDGPVEVVKFDGKHDRVLSASGSARQTTAVHPGSVRAWRYFQAVPSQSALAPPHNPFLSRKKSKIVLRNGVTVTHGENVVINQYALDSKQDRLATVSEDRTLRLWKASTGAPLRKPFLLAGPATAVALSDDGRRVATAAEETEESTAIRVWDLDTGYPASPPLSVNGRVEALRFLNEDRTLKAGTGSAGFTWSLLSSQETDTLERTIPERLRARLDERGEVVSVDKMSQTVMTRTLP